MDPKPTLKLLQGRLRGRRLQLLPGPLPDEPLRNQRRVSEEWQERSEPPVCLPTRILRKPQLQVKLLLVLMLTVVRMLSPISERVQIEGRLQIEAVPLSVPESQF